MRRRVQRIAFGIMYGAMGMLLPVSNAAALQDILDTPATSTELATSSLLLDVAQAGQRYVAVGERGHIIFSDDSGRSWEQAEVPVSTTLTAVYFPSPEKGWAVGHGGVVLATSDSGKTWIKQFDGYQANQMVIASAEKRIDDLEQKVDADPDNADLTYALEDAQFALEDAQTDAEVGASKPLLDVWFRDENVGFVIGAYGFFFKTIDGGKTWENWGGSIENQQRFHLNAISRITGGALFIAGEAGNIFRSTDAGETWETVESPYEGSLFGISGTGNVNEVLAFGLRGHLFRSVDMGETWDAVDTGSEVTLTSADTAADGKTVTLVGVSGVVLVSQNGGESFVGVEREDRLALTSVIKLRDQKLLLFGEKGVMIANSKGLDL